MVPNGQALMTSGEYGPRRELAQRAGLSLTGTMFLDPRPQSRGCVVVEGAKNARLWATALGVVVLTIAVVDTVALAANETTSNTILSILNIALVPIWTAFVLLGIRLHRPERPLPWLILGLGAGASNLAGTVLEGIDQLSSTPAEFPGIYEYFYLLAYLFIFAFFVMIIRARASVNKERSIILDTLTMVCALGLLMWLFILQPAMDGSLSFQAQAVTIAYPLSDLLVIWLGLRLVFGSGERSVAFWSFIVSELIIVTANTAYGWMELHGGTGASAWILLNLIWYAGATVMYASALHPSMATLTNRSSTSEPLAGRWRLLMVATAALMGPILLLVKRDSTTIIAITCAVMFLLVVIRLEGLLRLQSATNAALDTSLRQLQQADLQLRHAQKLESVGRLAGGVAHEINTPMQFISDNVRFLSESHASLVGLAQNYRNLIDDSNPVIATRLAQAEANDSLQDFDEEVPDAFLETLAGIDRVKTIVSAMKSFGDVQNEDPELVDINEAVTNTVTVAQNELQDTADVVLELGNIPRARCYRGDVNQILLNLVVNGRQAIADVVGESGEKGTLTITTTTRDDKVVLTVADTGAGIPENVRLNIFDPFFTTREVGKGTGQGLALVWSLVVDRHGGSIDFESEVGRGTKFIVTLPLDRSPAEL
jgi:signal transduction histidine kinase